MVGMRLGRFKKKKAELKASVENLENGGGRAPRDRDRGWTIHDPYVCIQNFVLYPKGIEKPL